MTTASERGKRNRRHGHETENMIVRWLKDNGYPHAHTTRSQLGHDGFRQPGDIGGVPGVVIEAKSVKSSAWPTWRAQVLAEAGGRIPVVVRRTRGVTDVGQWECEVPQPVYQDAWRSLGRSPLIRPDITLNRARWCPRTLEAWVRLPFGELMEGLR